MVETYLERHNYDGKACLLKSICHASNSPFDEDGGILAEIVQAVLTPSATNEISGNNLEYHEAEKLGKDVESCDNLFPDCQKDAFQQFSSFLS
ncbi:hypothetical protein NQ317_016767 [Molorchus minor]|uniref:Uncharacterized protein n=1 Tax=Molorchus minor TaxID=1323400 RepID=A0ABQ9JP15_9CUCU|nr:hypothetical protein NQ317_016767 [Molorchus minor]